MVIIYVWFGYFYFMDKVVIIVYFVVISNVLWVILLKIVKLNMNIFYIMFNFI